MIYFRDGRPIGVPRETAMDGEYLTVKEFAKRNNVTEAVVRQWKKRGLIDGTNYNGRAYICAKTQIRAKKSSGRPPKHQRKWS